jgi:deferrochelatase/peroxidase EfeB
MLNYSAKGAPLAKTPYRDDTYYLDPKRINDFDYTVGNPEGGPPYCPFAAHIRKTAPRNLNPLIQKEYLDASVIVRAGVPYGPEVSHPFILLEHTELEVHRLPKMNVMLGLNSLRRKKTKL